MKHRIVCLLLCIVLLSGFVTIPAAADSQSVIEHIDVTVEEPVSGQAPVGTCQIKTTGCELYKTDPIIWVDVETGNRVQSWDEFQEGKSYAIYIWVEAKSGYRFRTNAADLPDMTGTINGNLPPFINRAHEHDPDRIIELAYTFVNIPKSEEHTHSLSEWRTTQVYHYTVCTECGDMLQQEDHFGGVATCSEKGKCTVCGYAYLEENENHNPDTSEWVSRLDMYHYHRCIDCGAHCDVEDHRWSPTYLYKDDTGHAWICADCKANSEIVPHNPGPAATETEPQICTDCDYVIEPAKAHEHDLSRVPETPAECTLGGNIEYYFCTGCNDCFFDPNAKDKIPETMSVLVDPLGHTTSDNWEINEQYHWRVCTTCKMQLDETKMLHEMTDGTCVSCGYTVDSDVTVQETSSQETVTPETSSQETIMPETPTQESTSTENATQENTAPETSAQETTKPVEDTGSESKPTSEDKKNEGVGKSKSEKPSDTQKIPTTGRKRVSWVVIVLIGLVCFGVSVTATVIVLKRKK